MDFLRNALRKTPEYMNMLNAQRRGSSPLMATGLSRVHKTNIMDTLPVDVNRRAFVITADQSEAAKLSNDLTSLGRKPVVFNSRDLTLRSINGVSHEFESSRIGVLASLLNSFDYNNDILIAPIDAVLSFTMPPDILKALFIEVKADSVFDMNELIKKLVFAGYSRCKIIEGEGQFAVRGGILDIFVPGQENPFRIEFFSDEVDTVSEFDVISQRRIALKEIVYITPAREVLFEDPIEFINRLKEFCKKLPKKQQAAAEKIFTDIELLESGVSLSNIDKYLSICYETPGTLFDYVKNEVIFMVEPSKIAERMRNFFWQQNEDIKALYEDNILCKGLDKLCLSSAEFYQILEQSNTVMLETFNATSIGLKPKELFSFSLQSLPPFKGLVKELAEDINHYLNRGYACVVLAGSERGAIALTDNLIDSGYSAVYTKNIDKPIKNSITVTTGSLSSGLDFNATKLAVFTQSRVQSTKKRKFYSSGTAIGSLDELKRGEAVVHSIYGIGIFDGIKKIDTNGIIKDYITIKFLKNDVLYVPVTQLDLVSRYIGAGENSTIKLNRLGSDQWSKIKSRVKSAVKDMAKELIALYAKRMSLKGFAFAEDTDLQKNFEYYFPYEETDDQLKSTQEIKDDMQKNIPMERLLCGDVGFGKTEVALRAAFKCICDGKQCAMLVPTTILAWQHYNTILQRMENFPVNVEMLSRFRTPSQQTAIKKQLKRGAIDIIVGTHRLISSDIQFQDLGLLIIDEEQRFGVAQKEKLKKVYPEVDVLVLSATPIPRTLNMAMAGMRDMSVIEEAPQDRYPVQTYVLEHDKGIVIDAIRKELFRGGQVYYIYNRVETIDRVAARLKVQLPDANIATAHGQMDEVKLSEVWRGLIDGDIDVLVCTTIIETGVDVTNVNTLIIEDADRFGLSQLHQLRGRVGRSSRRAYAYLTFRRGKALSDIATKRLEAIREYTEFGSGFKIAMRDLEIRGAGNILGAKQHGHMESVGYDMYLKLLSNAVKEQKGEVVVQTVECVIDLQINAHIPESYIEDMPSRLQIYRRIAQIGNNEDSMDVMDELIDRFGEPPNAVLGLIEIALLKNRAAALGIKEITERNGSMLLYFEHFNFERASRIVGILKGRVLISAGEKPYVTVRAKKGQHQIDSLKEMLEAYESFDKKEG